METELQDGQSLEVQGSGAKPYVLKNTGGVFSCTCPAWCNQKIPIEQRTCKHLKALRGAEQEFARVGAAPTVATTPVKNAPVLLAHSWDNVTDLTGWWMSEKLDGVRAYWDGKRLLSRLGNPFHAPEWFTRELPDSPLDGELWGGRQQFQRTVSIVRQGDAPPEWRDISFQVFDAPAHPEPFEVRLDHLRSTLKGENVQLHPHELCRSLEHLREELARVESLGGEGLMLRKPASVYEVGRSWTLLKVKNFHDAEACVVGHQQGSGKHANRVGALLAQLPNGTSFSVGTGLSDAERESPPPVGSIITFRYQELSNAGVPRFPSYVGVRIDGPTQPFTTPKPKPEPAPVIEGGRRFELVAGNSAKFWQIAEKDCSLTVRFGRLGTAGQAQSKSYASPELRAKEAEKLIKEKTGKGYTEVGPGS